tara:strand:- start:19 stop:606 length:588 start_codon:yes stop_codon:yes gene_type:complete
MSLNKRHKSFVYEDEELMSQFQKGNENAYIELVNRYRNKLINFVFGYLGDKELSEDVIQDTMLKLYQKRHYYREIAKFSTWIYTIARNQANTELRKRKRRKTSFLSQMTKKEQDYDIKDKEPDLINKLQNEYIGNRIHRAIQLLPEHFKDVIVLRDLQQLSYDQISEIVSVPLGTVKSRINRARLQLQVELQDLK